MSESTSGSGAVWIRRMELGSVGWGWRGGWGWVELGNAERLALGDLPSYNPEHQRSHAFPHNYMAMFDYGSGRSRIV